MFLGISSQICCNRPKGRKRESTKQRDWSNHQTHSSWTSSALDAFKCMTISQLFPSCSTSFFADLSKYGLFWLSHTNIPSGHSAVLSHGMQMNRRLTLSFNLLNTVLSNNLLSLSDYWSSDIIVSNLEIFAYSQLFRNGIGVSTCFWTLLSNNRTTVFSHATTTVVCTSCQTVLCTPTGGKARLTEGCSFRRK